MMPDNRSPGKLEDFARRLVKSGDEGLWDHAGQATSESIVPGMPGLRPRTRSRPMFTRSSPGRKCQGVPMGLAITKQFLDADSSEARNFVAWLCRLYGFNSPRLGSQ